MAPKCSYSNWSVRMILRHGSHRFWKRSWCQLCGGLRWELAAPLTFFSVQRLHGFRQVVQHAQWHCKSINFQINTRGRLLIEGHKRELVKDLYIVQEAVIINNKPKNGKNKPPKQHKNKTETNPQKRNDWLPVHWQIHARGDNLVSSHHGMAANKDKKGRTPTYTRPYPQEGDRSNKAHCGNQGSPQPGSPRSQRAAVQA